MRVSTVAENKTREWEIAGGKTEGEREGRRRERKELVERQREICKEIKMGTEREREREGEERKREREREGKVRLMNMYS